MARTKLEKLSGDTFKGLTKSEMREVVGGDWSGCYDMCQDIYGNGSSMADACEDRCDPSGGSE